MKFESRKRRSGTELYFNLSSLCSNDNVVDLECFRLCEKKRQLEAVHWLFSPSARLVDLPRRHLALREVFERFKVSNILVF